MKTSHESEAALAAFGWTLVDLHSTIEANDVVIFVATIERSDDRRRTTLYNTDETKLIEECIQHARTYPARGSKGGAL